MRRLALTALPLLALALLPTGPAAAACYGTANTATFCYSTGSGTYYSDCVYLGSGPCRPITVTGPVVYCGGQVLGMMYICNIGP